MERLVSDIYEIIKDYREDEGMMTIERITSWINQFSPEDRIFVLQELKHILKQRYISKSNAKELLKGMIESLSINYKFNSPKDFLLQTTFIDNQPVGKSQKVLLKFIDEIIQAEYSISISECNQTKSKYYIYIDDILCTGDTLYKGLSKNEKENDGWFLKTNIVGKSNYEIFKENNAILILAYFCVHKANIKKALNRLQIAMGGKYIEIVYAFDEAFNIENDFENPNSKLNFLYPSESIRDGVINECQKQIENKVRGMGYNPTGIIRYRETNKPDRETFYTSASNRDRFEKIILNKSIEIYNHSKDFKDNLRARPLGYGLKSDMNLGFGALFFTWRNVPFNLPLVFWHQYSGWKPLFERKFSQYNSSSIESILMTIAGNKMNNMTQEAYLKILNLYKADREVIDYREYDKLFELDLNFLEETTGIEKKYWENGYINAPSFHNYFEKIKTYDKTTIKGYEAWASGYGGRQSFLYKYVIKNVDGIIFSDIEGLRKNVMESKGAGKGSAINTIKLGMSLIEQRNK